MKVSLFLSVALGLLDFAFARAPAGPWDQFNYAPSSKTVYPTAIHSSKGTVQDAVKLVGNKGPATISGKGSWVALDYGKEVILLRILFLPIL
jgi:hypothetical protein